jgi:hypothetical protein
MAPRSESPDNVLAAETTRALDTRAWTFQECALSSRLLYYGTKEVIWGCRMEALGSFVSFESPRDMGSTTLLRYAPSLAASIERSLFKPEESWVGRDVIWREIVTKYSQRNITVAADRLPALAGIASELHSVWNDTYIAGFWRQNLVRQLQ